MNMIERSWLAGIRLWEDPVHTAFLIVQLSHPYMTTGKTIALTRWTFVGKVMSLHFSMPSRLVITFLPRSSVQFSCSVVSNSLQPHELQHARPPCPSQQVSFNFMAAVITCSDFGAPKNNVCHCFHSFSIYLPWGDGTRCHDLCFLNVEL